MEKNEGLHDLIEKYLEKSLSTDELRLFEDQLKADPILVKELKIRQKIQESWIRASHKENVGKHIRDVIKSEKPASIKRNLIWLSAAASLILVLGLGSLLFFQRGQNLKDLEFISKGNSNLEESIIKGQRSEIKEYGSVEFANDNKNATYQRLLPRDGAIYQASDTITFVWPAASFDNNEPLIILDEEGQRVVEITLKTGSIGYKLLPSRLKPGSYTYILRPKALNYKFSINE
jgi:hypothetical protein